MFLLEFLICFNGRQYLLTITERDTLAIIKRKINSMCSVDLTNGEHVLEIYDTKIHDYVVLTELYWKHLNRFFSAMPTIQRFKVRVERSHQLGDASSVSIQHRNYLIVWLDDDIGRPQQHSSLKRMCNSMLHVEGASHLVFDEHRDYENLIRFEGEPIYTAIQFFDDPYTCLDFIQNNTASTTIFLVTCSRFARIIIPESFNRIHSTYILCHCLSTIIEWVTEYIDYTRILIYDFDLDLILRLTCDIANYCIEQGLTRIRENNEQEALKYFSDAKKLLLRLKMDKTSVFYRIVDDKIAMIDQQTLELKHIDEKISVECVDW